jgi:hypothetical protein
MDSIESKLVHRENASGFQPAMSALPQFHPLRLRHPLAGGEILIEMEVRGERAGQQRARNLYERSRSRPLASRQ